MQSHDGAQRPLPSTYCPFCTGKYRLPVVQERDSTDPFSLSNLLPAGTITVTVHDGESPCPSTSHNHNWHSLPIRSLSTHPADTLFRELAFLTEHLYLRATCTIGASGRTIFIRVYLIPNDLPNVHGRLHRRSETSGQGSSTPHAQYCTANRAKPWFVGCRRGLSRFSARVLLA
ncbi:hypothetical protein JVT61DRAFT_2405 [Boletus reticuloceps]|uniref:Uncharacterized protein n=1 Tax=Boletus reticuloceps TaxID=495285 RepID=A0A8I3A941_9AGAM|nr:hypothetical protein JVT61DRAFT_2405 [Boletus reticuloceps]